MGGTNLTSEYSKRSSPYPYTIRTTGVEYFDCGLMVLLVMNVRGSTQVSAYWIGIGFT